MLVTELPPDALANVLVLLSVKDICACACSCKTLRDVVRDDHRLWLPLAERLLPGTRVDQWILSSDKRVDTTLQEWPPTCFRQVLTTLTPLCCLMSGLWQDKDGNGTNGSIYAFQWLPTAILCCELDASATGVGQHAWTPLVWRVVCVLSRDSVDVPIVERLTEKQIILRPGHTHATSTSVVEARAATALGREGAALLGSSPTGSFEAEFLLFMASQSPGGSARKRRHRKPRGPATPSRWTRTLHLTRVPHCRPTLAHPLAGLWQGVYGRNGLQVVNVSYSFAGARPVIEAFKVTGSHIVPAGWLTWRVQTGASCEPTADEQRALAALWADGTLRWPATAQRAAASRFALADGSEVLSLADVAAACAPPRLSSAAEIARLSLSDAGADGSLLHGDEARFWTPPRGSRAGALPDSAHSGSSKLRRTGSSTIASPEAAVDAPSPPLPPRRSALQASGMGERRGAREEDELPVILAAHRGKGAVGVNPHRGASSEYWVDGSLWILSTGDLVFFWGVEYSFAVLYTRVRHDFAWR